MKFCPECGYKLTGTPKFCPECGAKLQGESASPAGGADWEAELADIGEKLDEQIGEYENKLALAKSYVLREKYAEAEKVYEELIEKNPQDMAGYIGLICAATGNYAKYEGGEIDRAIRVAQRMAGNARAEDFDEEYAKYAARRKKYFEDKESEAKKELERQGVRIDSGVLKKYTGYESVVVVPDGVTEIGEWAFAENEALKSVALPKGVTVVGERAFVGCASLTSITLPAGLTEIGKYAFSSCINLTSMTLPVGLKKIGGLAFMGCVNLESITFPAGIEKIGESAFSNCKSLKTITLSAGLTEIGKYAFYRCKNLVSITLPVGLQRIGDFAFEECENLTSIRLPAGLTEIGNFAFACCNNLKKVTMSRYTHIGNLVFPKDCEIVYR